MDHQDLRPYKIAFVYEGEVVDMLQAHEHLGALLLSQPLILDVSDKPEVMIGDKYDPESDTFSHA